MKLIKEVKNVLDFALTSKQCIIINSRSNRIELLDAVYDKLSESDPIENLREVRMVKPKLIAAKNNKAQLYFFDWSEYRFIFDAELTKKFSNYICPIGGQLKKDENSLGDYFLLNIRQKETRVKEIFHISIEEDFKIKWQFESEGLQYINGNYYDHYVSKYDKETGEMLWRTERVTFASTYVEDFNTRGEINQENILKLLGIHDGILWILLSSGRLIGLNDENGEVKYEVSGESCDYSKVTLNGSPKLPMLTTRFQYNSSDNEIFTITGVTFVRMDLNTHKFVIDYRYLNGSNSGLEMEVHMGRISSIPFDDNYYYVVNILTCQVGKINRVSLGFEEIIELGKNNGKILDFKLYNNKLYARQEDNTLNIISVN